MLYCEKQENWQRRLNEPLLISAWRCSHSGCLLFWTWSWRFHLPYPPTDISIFSFSCSLRLIFPSSLRRSPTDQWAHAYQPSRSASTWKQRRSSSATLWWSWFSLLYFSSSLITRLWSAICHGCTLNIQICTLRHSKTMTPFLCFFGLLCSLS